MKSIFKKPTYSRHGRFEIPFWDSPYYRTPELFGSHRNITWGTERWFAIHEVKRTSTTIAVKKNVVR